jgi:hypothetical protein
MTFIYNYIYFYNELFKNVADPSVLQPRISLRSRIYPGAVCSSMVLELQKELFFGAPFLRRQL